MKNFGLFCILGFFLLGSLLGPKHVLAETEYVMPYPGVMPGNKFYKVAEIVAYARGWWSVGNFSQFVYNLSRADIKLIEAKTLFEYKQYLLASKAIDRYKNHLRRAYTHLGKARLEGKNTTEKRQLFTAAIRKHREILEAIKREQPETFLWEAEKSTPQLINIKEMLDDAIVAGIACET